MGVETAPTPVEMTAPVVYTAADVQDSAPSPAPQPNPFGTRGENKIEFTSISLFCIVALVIALMFYFLVTLRFIEPLFCLLFLITVAIALILLGGFFLLQNKRDASFNGVLGTLCVGMLIRILLLFGEYIGGVVIFFFLFAVAYGGHYNSKGDDWASYFIVFVLVPFIYATVESTVLTVSLYFINKQPNFVRNRYTSFLYGMAFGLGSSLPLVAMLGYSFGIFRYHGVGPLLTTIVCIAAPVALAFVGGVMSSQLALEKFPGDQNGSGGFSPARIFAIVALGLWIIMGATAFAVYMLSNWLLFVMIACIVVSGVSVVGLLWTRYCLQQELSKIPLAQAATEEVVSAV